MLRGLTTVSFYAGDLAAAKRWYTDLLGFEPYFNRPGYVEFRIRFDDWPGRCRHLLARR